MLLALHAGASVRLRLFALPAVPVGVLRYC